MTTEETIEARKDLHRIGGPYFNSTAGRMTILVDGKQKLYSHYVWFLNTGHWPDWRNGKGEDIHHIDGDPLNDDFENLLLMTHAEHTSLHNSGENSSMYGRRGEKNHNWKGDDANAVAKYLRHYRYPNKYPPLTNEERENRRAYFRERYRKRKENSIVK